MLFTHFGLSGPLVLSASTHMTKAPLSRYQLRLDLKPALDEKTLDARLQRELSENANRNFSNMLEALLPKKMIDPFVARVGIAPDRKCHSITRAERGSILRLLKQMTFTVRALRPISEAIVTAGGVSVSEVDPKSMQSKCVAGLYLAGEVLDIDAYTGGFNLQLAFSTAYAAGMAAGSEDYT
jgi:predicted Rossmann fold flavoprotein